MTLAREKKIKIIVMLHELSDFVPELHVMYIRAPIILGVTHGVLSGLPD